MNKEEPKKSQQPKKVFDVMRPGKALASPTSRPVITGHKKIKEDMFVAGKEPKDKDARYATDNPFDDKSMMSHKDDKFASVKADEVEEQESKPEAQAAAVTTAPAVPDNFAEEETPKEPETPAEGHNEDIALVPSEDETAPPAPEPTKTEQDFGDLDLGDLDKELPPAPAKPESVQSAASPAPVADEQKESIQNDANHDVVASAGAPVLEHAVVSHHKVKSKWWEWALIFVIIVFVALVAMDLALDAELITLDMEIPTTNFIN
jgi:hypothetical protein